MHCYGGEIILIDRSNGYYYICCDSCSKLVTRLSMEKQAISRCKWTANITDPNYIEYHDTEWGTRVSDNRSLFELICLEGAMAGLSWNTILKKRKFYRDEFCDFEIERIVKMKDAQIGKILERGLIVKHAGKIKVCTNL